MLISYWKKSLVQALESIQCAHGERNLNTDSCEQSFVGVIFVFELGGLNRWKKWI